jgi:prepilin-type processing-associated H-X9-DG protein
LTGGCAFLFGLAPLLIFGAYWLGGPGASSSGQDPLSALFGSREKARQASCLSNEKQLCLGLLQYVQDYDEVYPPATQWTDGIQPYVKNNQILVCPSKPELSCGYAFNSNLGGSHTAELTQPASTVMLFESDWGMNAAGGPELLAAPRHQGGLDFGYADGHCKWLSASGYGALQWEPSDAPRAIN